MIPIADPQIGASERERVEAVLDSGALADGDVVRRFEDEFAAFCGVDHAVATSNGTTALHAAFEALGVGPGDEVVTTPFSFIASANAIRHAGAEPVFADIEATTFTLDPHAVETLLCEREDVVAILAVHLYGLPAQMGHLRDLADEYDVFLVEDAAQAHGAEFDHRRVGSLGDAACFSFYPTKNMTTGEGGMVTSPHEDVASRAASFVNHGRTGTYEHDVLGHNFRLTNIAAAIGCVQLDGLPEATLARRGNAAYLTSLLEDTGVITPREPSDRQHVYHQYTIRYDDRDGLRDALAAADVETGVYYPTPIHRQPVYADVTADVPVAERSTEQVLSLPIHPGVSTADLRTIAATIETYDSNSR